MMHLKLLYITHAFLDNKITIPKDILHLFLDVIIYKFPWWTLQENYDLYHKQYFNIYIDYDEARIINILYELNSMLSGFIEMMNDVALSDWETFKIDMRTVDCRYIAVRQLHDQCKTDWYKWSNDRKETDNFAKELSLMYMDDMAVVIDLSNFSIGYRRNNKRNKRNVSFGIDVYCNGQTQNECNIEESEED